jgi:Cof subfamily protein (haloacid dehalogenase superfamily)
MDRPPALVVTDMDGTLLNHSSTVSERNASALRRASEAGARVVIATGRPVWWLGPVLDVGFDGIAICMNGAIVYDIAAKEVLAAALLPADVMREFVTDLAARESEFGIAVERVGDQLMSCWAEPHYEHPWSDGIYQIASRQELLSEPAAKLLVRGGHSSLTLAEHARGAAAGRVAVTYSTDDGLIEVSALGVNKGAALSRLAAEWGIDRADAVAFGDMPNDLEMLAWAGHGVAMANGHSEVQALADEVVGLHYDDAVATVLERWF